MHKLQTCRIFNYKYYSKKKKKRKYILAFRRGKLTPIIVLLFIELEILKSLNMIRDVLERGDLINNVKPRMESVIL